MPRLLAAAVIAALALAGLGSVGSADEGWTIERFHADIRIRADASLLITEAIDVDFGTLQRHGIFRDIPVRYAWDKRHDRVYEVRVLGITDGSGKPWRYERSESGASIVLRIGDPDVFVSGRQSYRITYELRGALNAFPDHDELFWNVNGADWPVPSRAVSAEVRPESGTVQRIECFEGPTGSTRACRSAVGDGFAQFAASRPADPGEQLTIVVGLPKGAVAEPRVLLADRPREPDEWFEADPWRVAASTATLLGGLTLLGRAWWRTGRDRRAIRGSSIDEARPLLASDVIVAEYEPPEAARPAQIGVLVDERADPLDVTATIVDLAVRGYLGIEEVPATGLFGKKDWTLRRGRAADAGLQEYEATILDGLFSTGDEVKLSALKGGAFQGTLSRAQSQLYADAARRGWFVRDPSKVRLLWQGIGVGALVAGAFGAFLLGAAAGAGLVGVALAIVGIALLLASGAMPSRTAAGSEVLRRTLGFRRYIETAEKDRQRFAERENIFAAYLPYAIVFRAVDKWARAFSGLDAQAATAGWYAGRASFDAGTFSRDLSGFSSSVSSTIASTASSSGSSGFSGGSSGGGGGGGGGGSW